MIATLTKACLLAASLGMAGAPALAQPDREEDRPTTSQQSVLAGLGLLAIYATVPYLVSQKCGIGDPKVWPRIFVLLDERIRYCAGRHSAWQTQREKVAATLPLFGTTRPNVDTLAQASFEAMVAKLGADANEYSREKCAASRSSALWRDLLAPGSVSESDAASAWLEEDQLEAGNSHHCGRGLCPRVYKEMRHLGEDQTWVTAPCAELLPKAK